MDDTQGTEHPDQPIPEHRRPSGVDDKTVEALGKLSEALEVVEDARGHLYGFHRLSGMADLTLGEAVELFRAAGHDGLADRLESELVGRNVVEGRWTFQIVEEYDDDYYATFKRLEEQARGDLVGGRRHLFEAEMKEDRRTRGRAHHEAVPGGSAAARSPQNPET
ncbi:hypothetical protein [Humibacillus xanthopallidus]|uniref:Uncharacterized protein n=1 Tax=Humibacillus xanthopallidus TaxID=412689 RepID=A0A543HV20_9MICO|nr:hypothetical protein [Humibacillus xanthopallidus]TQM62201.1 hypothetical protein FBY41_2230 [Humibacillus xanthopallidus]